MRAFYESTHWFWVISRIIFVLMFIISIMQILNDGSLRHGDELLVNALCMLGTLMLVALAIIELARGNKPTWLRITGGVFLALFSLGLCALLFSGLVHGGLTLLLMLFIAWFLLASIRDFVVR